MAFFICNITEENCEYVSRNIIIMIDAYRVVHDLWTTLQEIISYVFIIKKVNIDIGPILNVYGVMVFF